MLEIVHKDSYNDRIKRQRSMDGGVKVIKDECKYYVFDKVENRFIEENGKMAEVNGRYIKELKEEISVLYLTFVEKRDYDDFVNYKLKSE